MELTALLANLYSGATDDARWFAARQVGAMGSAAIEPLQTGVCAEDSQVRWWSVVALAEIPGEAATAALCVAARDVDEAVRAGALHALGARRAGIAELVRALDDPSTFVALQAAHAVAQSDATAVPALMQVLQTGSAQARTAAARALAAIQSSAAIPTLIAALDDASPAVEFYALHGLERMGVGMVLIQPG